MPADIINLSLQIGSDCGDPGPEITDSVNHAVTNGVLVVAAAGNISLEKQQKGLLDGTMSRLSSLPGVISVGSANWEGTHLSSFSARGIAGKPQSGPTVIAPGEDMIGLHLFGKPKTYQQRQRDNQLITQSNMMRQSGQPADSKTIRRLKKTHTVKSGTSMTCACMSGVLAKFVELRKKFELSHQYADALEFLRRAARRIDGCAEHEQGLGFVSHVTIQEYFSAMQNEDEFWPGVQFDLLAAWNAAKGDGVLVGVADTGFSDHPFFPEMT